MTQCLVMTTLETAAMKVSYLSMIFINTLANGLGMGKGAGLLNEEL